ncbi:MAG: helix-turn-helix domain-containing protein [Alphaproteobacteria bacterium]|nr:helix-turn-helix domain-containing protein [Alphaproteobacteria bacterium]MBU0858956.1 helix-turn-helix domain-containing protein [Alphaproteobacteria bacterium]
MKFITITAGDAGLRAAIAAALAAHDMAAHRVCAPGEAAAGDHVLSAPAHIFRMGALLDDVRARSQADTDHADFAVGPYILSARDALLRRADGGGDDVRLTEKERDILLTLNALNGAVMERAALLEAVWGYAAGIETHTLETHIYRLRQKIEIDPAAPLILITEDSGYRLAD